jgi:ferredoxin
MTVHPRALEYTQSLLPGVIPQEAELTAETTIEPGRSYGFFTDTTLCIGCKACEVACKEWNQLPAELDHDERRLQTLLARAVSRVVSHGRVVSH